MKKLNIYKILSDQGISVIHDKCLCPLHSENTPSFTIYENGEKFKCFGCGAQGDGLDLQKALGINIVVRSNGDMIPLPHNAPARPSHFKNHEIKKYWDYTDKYGNFIISVCLFFDDKGKKNTPPLTYRNPGFWKFKGFPKDYSERPLYNLQRIFAEQKKPIVIVEGEKCAEKLQEITNDYVVTTWMGGTGGVSKTDFSILNGRDVVLWPDNDAPGRKAMQYICNRTGHNKMIVIPNGKPKGWDCADMIEEDGADSVLKTLNTTTELKIKKPEDEQLELPTTTTDDKPFRCLGYFENNYYYLPEKKGQAICINGSQHNENMLATIAPLKYWMNTFPKTNDDGEVKGVNYRNARESLLREQENIGIYDRQSVRGIGVWYEHGSAILNLGDRLYKNLQEIKYSDSTLQKTYLKSIPLKNDFSGVLMPTDQSIEILNIFQSLKFKNPADALLLAGWVTLAPVCGALSWRPHIHITGGAGTGKSWVMNNIIKPITGNISLFVQGATTEAGIRQTLRNDGRPVLFDEFDADDADGVRRIQTIYELARQSSSDSAGQLLKGSSGGEATGFYSPAMFCFAGIFNNVSNQSDESRITPLELLKNKDGFESIKQQVIKNITIETCKHLRVRTLKTLINIKQNIVLFSNIITELAGDRRIGDQYGTLLAGAYSLRSSNIATESDINNFIKPIEFNTGARSESDEQKCFDHILESIIRNEKNEEHSIREMINSCHPSFSNSERNIKTCMRYGIKTDVQNHYIYIPKTHGQIQRILNGTPWQKGYFNLMERLPGVEKKTARFGYKSVYCLKIPYEFKAESFAVQTEAIY